MLTGGHPNSLGRTVEVVDLILADRKQLPRLFDCYDSADPVVRMRTSNALKRICRSQPEWLLPFIDRLILQVSALDQASAQWTLATLFYLLEPGMDAAQKNAAGRILKKNLEQHDDWIVLNTTMDTLAAWSDDDTRLKNWLLPRLKKLEADNRGSVARKAAKILARFSAQ